MLGTSKLKVEVFISIVCYGIIYEKELENWNKSEFFSRQYIYVIFLFFILFFSWSSYLKWNLEINKNKTKQADV